MVLVAFILSGIGTSTRSPSLPKAYIVAFDNATSTISSEIKLSRVITGIVDFDLRDLESCNKDIRSLLFIEGCDVDGFCDGGRERHTEEVENGIKCG